MARTKVRSGNVGPRIEQHEEDRSSPAEVRLQVNVATTLVALNFSKEQIRETLRDKHGLSKSVADRRIEVAWREMRASFRIPLEDHRTLQHARILQELTAARESGKHAAVARYEETLMKLLGTAMPVRISFENQNDERERVLGVMMLLDEATIAAVLSGDERVALGHVRTVTAGSGEPEAADTPSRDEP